MSATPTPAPVSPAAAPVDPLMAARTAARVVPPVPVVLPSQAPDAPRPATSAGLPYANAGPAFTDGSYLPVPDTLESPLPGGGSSSGPPSPRLTSGSAGLATPGPRCAA